MSTETLPSSGGVYRVKIADMFYIGQTADLKRREAFHRSALLRGVSTSRELQAHYDLVGEYEFDVLFHEDDEDVRLDVEGKIIQFFADDERLANRQGSKPRPESARLRTKRALRGGHNYYAKRDDGVLIFFCTGLQMAHHFDVSHQTIKNYMEGKSPLPGTGKVLNKRTAHLVGWSFHYVD